MTSPSQSDIVALLTARLEADPARSPLTPSEFWRLRRGIADLCHLLGQPATGIGALLAVDQSLAERVARLLESDAALRSEQGRLADEGFSYVSATDLTFPGRLRKRLGDSCPPLLLSAGRLDLLSAGGVGVVGSRNVDENGAEIARQVGMAAASHQRSVVSGAASGVDSIAMGAASGLGGPVIGVPAEGLRRVMKRRTSGLARIVYVSPFSPDAPFSVGNAMARNKIIYALADFTLVVASDHGTGGTWQGATEALRRRFGPVSVWRGSGEGPGNAGIERLGAQRVTTVDDLFEEPENPVPELDLGLG